MSPRDTMWKESKILHLPYANYCLLLCSVSGWTIMQEPWFILISFQFCEVNCVVFQITEQIKSLHQEKLQPYKIEIAKDDAKAMKLVSEFEATIYTPAVVSVHSCLVAHFVQTFFQKGPEQVLNCLIGKPCYLCTSSQAYLHSVFKPLQALVRCAEDVIHTLAEIVPFEVQTRDHWVLDLERLKEKVYSAVHFILQTLRAVSKYHHSYKKVPTSSVIHSSILKHWCPSWSFNCSSDRPAAGTVWSFMTMSSRSCCLVLMETQLHLGGKGRTGELFLHGDGEYRISWRKILLQKKRSWFIWPICPVLSLMMRSIRQASRCLRGEWSESRDI